MEGIIEGPGYRVEVVSGFRPPSFKAENEIVVGDSILLADVKTGVLGDYLSGLLIPPVRCNGSLKRLEEYYKTRVTVEQGYEIKQRLDGMVNLVKIPIEFIPISRMSLIKNAYPCILNQALQEVGVDGLREEYKKYITYIGKLDGNYVTLMGKAISSSKTKLIGNIGKNVILGLISLSSGKQWVGMQKCKPEELILRPYKLLSLPEGEIRMDCGSEDDSYLKEYKCNRPSILSGSQICNDGKRKVVIKEYMYGSLKWFMAGAVSASIYPFRQTPLGRLSNEYRHLLELRKVIPTPRVYAVCPDRYWSKMVREFIEGEVALKSKDPKAWEKIGEALATIHNGGFALGDPNPGNFIITDNEVYIIDLEQASSYSTKKAAWDIAVFFSYARAFLAGYRLVKRSLEAYSADREKGEWKAIVEYIKGPLLTTLMSAVPNLLIELRLLLRDLGAT
ncbi:MAG: hypothetical protein LRS41_03865 [Caldisphaeraceae archaeon]|nr:hypothetical protein [Caldisphaeraceae archaeon]